MRKRYAILSMAYIIASFHSMVNWTLSTSPSMRSQNLHRSTLDRSQLYLVTIIHSTRAARLLNSNTLSRWHKMTANLRYIPIKAIEIDGKLIPIWEFNYENRDRGDYCVETFTHQSGRGFGSYNDGSIIDCMYDLLKKKAFRYTAIIAMCETKFSVGENVLLEKKHHELSEKTIESIIVGSLDNEEVVAGEEVIRRLRHYPQGMELGDGAIVSPELIRKSDLYTIRRHRSRYVFTDGTTTEWDHDLYRMVD